VSTKVTDGKPAWLAQNQKLDKVKPEVCSGAALADVAAKDAACKEALDAGSGIMINYDLLNKYAHTQECFEAARDKDGKSFDNNNIAEAVEEADNLQANDKKLEDPSRKDSGPKIKKVGKLSIRPEHYLWSSNPRERQHRLMCMIGRREKTLAALPKNGTRAAATKETLGKLKKDVEEWKTVFKEQETACHASLGFEAATKFVESSRKCLASFTDDEAVKLLQCRGRDGDDRTLFEVRDFLCLHGNQAQRDEFYAKLRGDEAAVKSAQKHYEGPDAATQYRFDKTLNQIHAMDTKISSLEEASSKSHAPPAGGK
jgi:hypothetical protein